MPHLQKFSEKSFWVLSSRNRTEEGVGLEEENAPKRRGFQDGVELRLGAIKQTNARRREREKETIKKVLTTAV